MSGALRIRAIRHLKDRYQRVEAVGWTIHIGIHARVLAAFYRRLLGWTVEQDEPDWVKLKAPAGGAGLSVQTESAYVRPTWPAGPGDQQMMLHLDIEVDGESWWSAVAPPTAARGHGQSAATATRTTDPARSDRLAAGHALANRSRRRSNT